MAMNPGRKPCIIFTVSGEFRFPIGILMKAGLFDVGIQFVGPKAWFSNFFRRAKNHSQALFSSFDWAVGSG